MWEAIKQIWVDLKTAIIAYFAKQAGRAEVTKEHKELADAARRDFEEIDNDGRSPDGVYGRLRLRQRSPAPAKRDPGAEQ